MAHDNDNLIASPDCAQFDTRAALLVHLARLCRDAKSSSAELDAAIHDARLVLTNDGDWEMYFTSSIDCAIELIPPGWRLVLREGVPNRCASDEDGFFARLESHDFDGSESEDGIFRITEGREVRSWAATAALSICAAALCAHALEESENELEL